MRKRASPVDRARFATLYAHGASADEISAELGISPDYVRALASRMGLARGVRRGAGQRQFMDAATRKDRLQGDAEHILEKIMCRRNWSSPVRDDLVDALERICAREEKRAERRG